MTIVIVNLEKDKYTRENKYVVSHGIDENDNNVVLPQVTPDQLGCKYDIEMGEWYIE